MSSCLRLETPPLVVQIMSVYDTRYSTEAEESAKRRPLPNLACGKCKSIQITSSSSPSQSHAERLLEIIKLPLFGPIMSNEREILRGQGSGAAGRGAGVCGRWRGQVELGVVGHHAVEADGHALDDSQQDGARYRAVAHRLVASSYRERATSEEPGNDGVPRVLLLPYSLDGAVVCVE
jgi:hypothetical protein